MKTTEQVINLTPPIDGVQYGYSTTEPIKDGDYGIDNNIIFKKDYRIIPPLNSKKVIYSTNPKDIRFPYLVMPSIQIKEQEQIFSELIEKLGGFDNDRYKLQGDYFIIEKNNRLPSKEQEAESVFVIQDQENLIQSVHSSRKEAEKEREVLRIGYAPSVDFYVSEHKIAGFNSNPAKYTQEQMEKAILVAFSVGTRTYIEPLPTFQEARTMVYQSLQPTAKAVRVEMEETGWTGDADCLRNAFGVEEFKIKVEQSTEYSQGIVKALEVIY